MTDASHLLGFAAWDNYTVERINKMFDLVNTVRGFKNEGWEAYRQQILATYPQRDAETNYQHAARQAYIGYKGPALTAGDPVLQEAKLLVLEAPDEFNTFAAGKGWKDLAEELGDE